MPVTVSNLQVLRPDFELDKKKAWKWIAAIHARASSVGYEDLLQQLRRIGLGDSKIQKRGVSLTDHFYYDWDRMEVYDAYPSGAGFGKRSEVFDRIATGMLSRFYPEKASLPAHLIHVTCTGYVAPSPAQKLVSLKQAGQKTAVTYAYHMGCYAAIPALRMAVGFHEPTDIVHTEVCSLHLNPLLHGLEQLVVQSLFADVFIKYSLSSQESSGFQVLKLREEIIPDSLETMGWVC